MFQHQPPDFSATADSVLNVAKRVVEQGRALQDLLVATITPETASFSNTVLPLAQNENLRYRETALIELHARVSPDVQLRDSSSEALKIIADFEAESGSRQDLYPLLQAVKDSSSALDPESKLLLDDLLLASTRSGVHLSEDIRTRLVKIKKDLKQICREFEQNLVKDSDAGEVLSFTREELTGVPEHIIAELPAGSIADTFSVRVQPQSLQPILRYASRSSTRKQLAIANANRCEENVPLLQKAIVLRDEAARLRGYSNHAEYELEITMEKSVSVVSGFLEGLRRKLIPTRDASLAKLKELKARELGSLINGEIDDGTLYIWDYAYYSRLLEQQQSGVDQEAIAEYFPLDTMIDRMLGIFEHLFHMKFVHVEGESFAKLTKDAGRSLTWHEDVKFYEVWDASDSSSGSSGKNAFLGHLYMDLHPRGGKFGHVADFAVSPGFTNADGSRTYPATALVCNFEKATPKRPSLLKHWEVTVLFHELGHGIHDLVSKTTYARYHGPAVKPPFSEAPSQMLENWCWTPSILRSLSQHYSTLSQDYLEAWRLESPGRDTIVPPEQLSHEHIAALCERRRGADQKYCQSLAMATFDMRIHQPESHSEAKGMDTTFLWNTVKEEITGLHGPKTEDDRYHWGHGQSTFAHEFRGYDAGFYGYLSSEMYAADMFRTGFELDPMDSEAGIRYRREVLEPGGSKDPWDMLEIFLGRPPNSAAFYASLGLE